MDIIISTERSVHSTKPELTMFTRKVPQFHKQIYTNFDQYQYFVVFISFWIILYFSIRLNFHALHSFSSKLSIFQYGGHWPTLGSSLIFLFCSSGVDAIPEIIVLYSLMILVSPFFMLILAGCIFNGGLFTDFVEFFKSWEMFVLLDRKRKFMYEDKWICRAVKFMAIY